jgi:putative isomerase
MFSPQIAIRVEYRPMKRASVRPGIGLLLLALAWLALPWGAHFREVLGRGESEAAAIARRLATGWNTWDSRSVLAQVLLPEAFSFRLAFKQHRWIEESFLGDALIGRRGEGAERIVPGARSWDGRVSTLDLRWQELSARVDTAHDGEDVVVLVTPAAKPAAPVTLVVESALLWNRPGTLAREGDTLRATLPTATVRVFATARHLDDPFVPTRTPYLALPLDGPIGISTGRSRTLEEIRAVVARQSRGPAAARQADGSLAEALTAVESAIGWNTVYDPRNSRVISTVGRLWNEEYGGYALFGWDNFFLSYASALFSRDLAFANVLEHLAGRTGEGFIPNDNAGNGRKSYDRSQPPVGSLMVREVYRRYPERWFLEATFDALLAWNRWWPAKRLNGELLSYGSHAAPNPFSEPSRETMVTAGYESGMDDSPMYEGVPFDKRTGTMALQDVGLTSLYIADCRALADIARLLGRPEVRELSDRADRFGRALNALWDEQTGLYLNRRSDTGAFSRRLSPTHFYPLLAQVPDPDRARRMIDAHLLNPAEFWGEFVLPSVSRDDAAFPRQRYWKGAIWPPLNFLTYLGLRRYGFETARRELADRSLALLLDGWRRGGQINENYSSMTGRGDDEKLSSDRFHTWGVLLALPALIEGGKLGAPESPIK